MLHPKFNFQESFWREVLTSICSLVSCGFPTRYDRRVRKQMSESTLHLTAFTLISTHTHESSSPSQSSSDQALIPNFQNEEGWRPNLVYKKSSVLRAPNDQKRERIIAHLNPTVSNEFKYEWME